MHEWHSQSHVKWECKYHVVFIPKYRQKVFYGKMRRKVGTILRGLCEQKGVEMLEGNAMSDHIHLCLSIPPKFSVSHTIGFLKGKSAIKIHRDLMKHKRMTGCIFGPKAIALARSVSMKWSFASIFENKIGMIKSRQSSILMMNK